MHTYRSPSAPSFFFSSILKSSFLSFNEKSIHVLTWKCCSGQYMCALSLNSLFFSATWTNPASLHHSLHQHIKVSYRLIILVFMCSQWLIGSQRAGRLLRSQINWHYSQDCVPIFYSHDLTQICCFPITANNKKLHTVIQLLNHMNRWHTIRFWDMRQICV